jgi:hypothetical protein
MGKKKIKQLQYDVQTIWIEKLANREQIDRLMKVIDDFVDEKIRSDPANLFIFLSLRCCYNYDRIREDLRSHFGFVGPSDEVIRKRADRFRQHLFEKVEELWEWIIE